MRPDKETIDKYTKVFGSLLPKVILDFTKLMDSLPFTDKSIANQVLINLLFSSYAMGLIDGMNIKLSLSMKTGVV